MKKYEGVLSGEDPTCWVQCECGKQSEIISNWRVTICPDCGRKYRTEFIVWQFEPDEKVEEDGKAN